MFIVLVYGFGSGQFLDLFFGLVVQFEQTRNDRNNNRNRIEINKIASNPKLAIASQKLTINLAKVLLTLWNEPKHLVSITAPALLSNYHTCIRPYLLMLNLSISESLYFRKLKVVCLPASLPISDAVCQYVFFYLGFVCLSVKCLAHCTLSLNQCFNVHCGQTIKRANIPFFNLIVTHLLCHCLT